MCGRYTLRTKPEKVAQEFDLPDVPVLTPRFNIAPAQPVAVVRFDPIEGGTPARFPDLGADPVLGG